MSSGKKHRLEGEAEDVQKVKKVKTTESAVAEEDAPVKEKKQKKEKKDKEGKKEKKDKKDKKDKKEKKEKKRKEKEPAEQENGEVAAEADAMDVDIAADAAVASDEPVTKKEKKDKKSKDKKEKKSKKTESVPASDAPAPLPATNGAPNLKYQQSDALATVPQVEVDAFLTENHITIHDATNPSSKLRPILKFAHLPTTRLLSKNPFGTFTIPTPIQAASWPFSLSGRDVIGIAETGSGKTYAFSLPCVEALCNLPAKKSERYATYARAVIVSPTRELAMQTHSSISTMASLVGLSAVCLFGGASKDEQRALLRKNKGADIIVATPGRLKDFLSEGCVSLAEAAFVVLDEADRMLDKGFEDDIKEIIGQCPQKGQRQTLMFTATWPATVRGLAESFMVDPVKVIINKNKPGGEAGDGDGTGDGTVELQANSRIEQTVEVVDPRGKERRLLEILKDAQRGKGRTDRILVFCLYKKETTRVEQFLESRGVSVCAIHGDLRQDQRTRSLEAFKAGTTTVMLATDVAARGLDIPEVKLVVNLTVRATATVHIDEKDLQLTKPSLVPPDHRGLRPPYWSYRTCRQARQGHHPLY